jgi:hypothetical protein
MVTVPILDLIVVGFAVYFTVDVLTVVYCFVVVGFPVDILMVVYFVVVGFPVDVLMVVPGLFVVVFEPPCPGHGLNKKYMFYFRLWAYQGHPGFQHPGLNQRLNIF